MKEIILTQNKVTIVDDHNFEELNQYHWWAYKGLNTYYAERYTHFNGRGIRVKMHRQILGLSFGDNKLGDHKDRNGLHNWVANLRIVSKSLNNYNTMLRTNNTSGYRGVNIHHDRCRFSFAAVISKDKKRIDLGRFPSAIDSALAYDKAAKELYGDNAILNFPERINP